jgi:hypothetical protein
MKTQAVTIHFKASLYTLKRWTVLRVPEKESEKLPSRGQVAVTGMINGHAFKTVLEPDGHWSHWMRVDASLQQAAGARAGDTATLEMTPTKDWPEPKIPSDFSAALKAAPEKIHAIWNDITPMARWEWIRWVNATSVAETRQRRVEVSISKMNSGKRRPCCFNLAACTDPDLAKNGRLMEPA